MNINIKQTLDRLNASQLKLICKILGTGKGAQRKDDLIYHLRNYLINRTRDLLVHLTDVQKLYLSELLYDGTIIPAAFTAKYRMKCPFPLPYGERDTPFLVFVPEFYHDASPAIPVEMIAPLRELLPHPPKATLETVANIPTTTLELNDFKCNRSGGRPIHIFEGERTAIQEARNVLFLVQQGKIPVTDKTKKPAASSVKALSTALTAPDFQLDPPVIQKYTVLSGPVRTYAWGVIAQQANWCRSRKGKLHLTPQGEELLASPDADQIKKGYLNLLENDDFDEMNRINHIRGQTGSGARYMSLPSDRKLAIHEGLATFPLNQWISVTHAFDYLHANNNGFYVINDGYNLYLSEKQYGHLSGEEYGISMQYFRAYLFETLATLGLIDVAYTYPHGIWPEFDRTWGSQGCDYCGRYDGLLFIRLNPLGEYCLGITQTYTTSEISTPKTLKIMPNHEIVFVGDRAHIALDRHFLDQIAIPNGDFGWTLDRNRILSYMEKKRPLEDIIHFLEERSIEKIPQTVVQFLKDIDSKSDLFGETREAILIEVKDPMLADLIAFNTNIKKYCMKAGERHLVVYKKNLNTFRNAVKKMGYVVS